MNSQSPHARVSPLTEELDSMTHSADIRNPGSEAGRSHAGCTYMAIREFLDRVAAHHRDMADYYAEFAEARADEVQTRAFANAAQWRHEAIQRSLERYASQSGQVLSTWLQTLPDGKVCDLIAERPALDASLDDLLEHGIAFERALEQMYTQLIGHSSVPRVRDLFEGLARLEAGLARRISWTQQELIM